MTIQKLLKGINPYSLHTWSFFIIVNYILIFSGNKRLSCFLLFLRLQTKSLTMKMNSFHLFIFLIALILTVACTNNSETSESEEAQVEACKISKTMKNGAIFSQAIYSEEGMVQAVAYYENDELKSKDVWSYGEDGLPNKISYEDSTGQVVRYQEILERNDSSYITKRAFFEVDSSGENFNLWRQASYVYDQSKPNPLVETTFYDAEGGVVESYTIEYTDENGSSISQRVDAEGNLIRTETWKRDDKKSGNQAIMLFPFQEEHNLIERTVMMADSSISDNSWKSNLTYNELGYPIQAISKQYDGMVDTFSMEYICE